MQQDSDWRENLQDNIKPAMTYAAEYWPVKKQYMHKWVARMRMLRWMFGKLGKIEVEMSAFMSI